nr:xylulose kinase-1 [Tanacetum cinerariifolium]
MALTFADTHNMIAFLTKSDASEGFNQIIDFLNASSIKYALTVNPNIYVSVIKQFWSSVAVKKMNDVSRLQALVDRKKVIITEAKIRDALHLDDAKGIDCLPNEEIFTKKQVGDLSSHTIKYSSPALKQKVFANMKRVGKGCSGVDTPIFEGMIVAQQVGEGAAEVNVEDVSTAGVAAEGAASAADDEVPAAVDGPSIPSPLPSAQPPTTSQDIHSTSQVPFTPPPSLISVPQSPQHQTQPSQDARISMDLLQNLLDTYVQDAEIEESLVTAASAIITVAAPQLTTYAAPTLTTAPSATRRRKKVVIRDPEETATPSTVIHTEAKSKDKGKRILVEEPKPLKKQAQIIHDEAYARELKAKLNKNMD